MLRVAERSGVHRYHSLGLSLTVRDEGRPRISGRPAGRWSYPDGELLGQGFVDGTVRWIDWQDMGLFRFERDSRHVDAWSRYPAGDPRLERVFAHEIQPLVLQSLGCETLHGASAHGPDGAIALCGKSGAGKSTLSFALGRSGWSQMSDDHVIIDFDDEMPRVRSVDFQPSLRPASAAHFSVDSTREPLRRSSKDHAPLLSIIIVEQSSELKEWMQVSRVPTVAAFPAVLPHAHAFDPFDPLESTRLVNHYLSLVDSVPVYHLRYRPDFSRLNDLVEIVKRDLR